MFGYSVLNTALRTMNSSVARMHDGVPVVVLHVVWKRATVRQKS